MVKRLIIFSTILGFLMSCREEKQSQMDMEKYVENKVWLHFHNQNDKSPRQLYFNKSDGKRYIYSATEIRGEDIFDLNNMYSPWKKYKGTPVTNLHPTVEETLFRRNYEG